MFLNVDFDAYFVSFAPCVYPSPLVEFVRLCWVNTYRILNHLIQVIVLLSIEIKLTQTNAIVLKLYVEFECMLPKN